MSAQEVSEDFEFSVFLDGCECRRIVFVDLDDDVVEFRDVSVCMYVCMYVCVCVYVCVCMCMCAYVCAEGLSL